MYRYFISSSKSRFGREPIFPKSPSVIYYGIKPMSANQEFQRATFPSQNPPWKFNLNDIK